MRLPTHFSWETGTPESWVFLMTRSRLARNLRGLPFPAVDSGTTGKEVELLPDNLSALPRRPRPGRPVAHKGNPLPVVAEKVSRALGIGGQDRSRDGWRRVAASGLTNGQKDYLFAHGLVNRDWLRRSEGVLFFQTGKPESVLVGEEDHLRLQVLCPGLGTVEAWERTRALEERLEAAGLRFAFSSRLGYLTTCPTNIGTGLRVSVLGHFRGLFLLGRLNPLLAELRRLGFEIRGREGEGSGGEGPFVQISNKTTLGREEEDIRAGVTRALELMADREREAWEILKRTRRLEIEDLVFRAHALLSSARLLDFEEALAHLSSLYLGYSLGWIQPPRTAAESSNPTVPKKKKKTIQAKKKKKKTALAGAAAAKKKESPAVEEFPLPGSLPGLLREGHLNYTGGRKSKAAGETSGPSDTSRRRRADFLRAWLNPP